jgi:hypothetical protein
LREIILPVGLVALAVDLLWPAGRRRGRRVDIRAVAQAVQLEDAIQQSASEGKVSPVGTFTPISETTMLAEQASACLVDNARMLEEYFSVVIEIDEDKNYADGSTVLLEGYTLSNTRTPDVPSSVGDRS